MAVPIGVFKSYANIDHAIDVQARWLDLVSEPSWRLKNEQLLEQHTTPCSSISHVRNVVFSSYLARKWKISFPEVLKWVEEGIKTLPLSIRRLMRTVSVLPKIGFDQESVKFRLTNLQLSTLFNNNFFFFFIFRYGKILPCYKAIQIV